MRQPRQRFWAVLVAALALILGACSDDEGGGGTGDTGDTGDTSDGGGDADATPDVTPDTQPDGEPDMLPDAEPDAEPAEFVTLNFTIDDSANGTYGTTDGLAWKGSFNYDSETNTLTYDGAWAGPFVNLYDDGPLSADGHEPEGATAGDHIWGAAVLYEIPDADQAFEYGAIRGSTDGSDGDWIWTGPNGTFTVPAASVDGDEIDVPGLVIPEFGWIDVRFSLDGLGIDSDFSDSPPTAVELKSSAWGWTLIDLTEDGDTDQWSVVLSEAVGPDTDLPHAGLMYAGDEPEFVFVLDGVEYKVGGAPPGDGVTVEVYVLGTYEEIAVANRGEGDMNTFVTIPYAPPRNVVQVNFCIDDTANASYGAACAEGEPLCDGLALKGSLNYDAARRTLTHDGAWTGPFALLYDDGPWDEGGHEPAGETADDSIWCLTAFHPTVDANVDFEYGAIRGSVDGSDGQWIWIGSNGTFTVEASAVEGDSVDLAGLTVPAWGTYDMQLTLDGASLDEGFSTTAPLGVNVKGSAWGWVEIPMTDDTDELWTFVLGDNVGEGTDQPHAGLLNPGDMPQFVFVVDGVEYKVAGSAATAGVTAEIDDGAGGAFSEVTVEVQAEGDHNTFVTVPSE